MAGVNFVPSWLRGESLSDRSRQRYATPKHQMTARVDMKAAKDKDDEKQLAIWRAEVRRLDKSICRVCGVKTLKTIELDPKRGEAHHVEGRSDKAVRYDVRNGLHCCLSCHQKFTLGKLFIHQIAKHLFTVGQTTYINARKLVTFSEKPTP